MYKCYVCASNPFAAWFMLNPARTWLALANPLSAYLQGVSENYNGVLVDVLANTDLSQFTPGAQLYVGYGTSSDEMMAAGRYNTYTIS